MPRTTGMLHVTERRVATSERTPSPPAQDAIDQDSVSPSGLSTVRHYQCRGARVPNDAAPGPGMVKCW